MLILLANSVLVAVIPLGRDSDEQLWFGLASILIKRDLFK